MTPDGFYLGTHVPKWVSFVRGVPLFISRATISKVKTLWRATTRFSIDSAAFSEVSTYGKWITTERQLIDEYRRIVQGVGTPDFVCPMDMMCEEHILKKTGKTVPDHQNWTVENYCRLAQAAPELPWIPVIQGYTVGDYAQCVRLYERAGVDLAGQRTVGLGSVCRRQKTPEIVGIVQELSWLKNLHGFGVKTQGIRQIGRLLQSADSLAWSFEARRSAPLESHEGRHKNCANCWEWAHQWWMRIASSISRMNGDL